MKEFYYVHNRGLGNPTHRHSTFDEAAKEAKRLSKKTRRNFYILKSVGHVEYRSSDVIDTKVEKQTTK